MVRVICDCNVGFEGVRYPKGVPADLPEEVVISLGERATRLPVEPAPEPEKPEPAPEPAKAPKGKAPKEPEPADPVHSKPLTPEKRE